MELAAGEQAWCEKLNSPAIRIHSRPEHVRFLGGGFISQNFEILKFKHVQKCSMYIRTAVRVVLLVHSCG